MALAKRLNKSNWSLIFGETKNVDDERRREEEEEEEEEENEKRRRGGAKIKKVWIL